MHQDNTYTKSWSWSWSSSITHNNKKCNYNTMILLLLLLFNPNYLITTTNAFVTTTTPIKTTSCYNNNNSFFIQKHQEQSRILKRYNYQHGTNGNYKVLNASTKSIQESDANNNNKNIISILSQNVIDQFMKKKLIVKNILSRNRKNKKMVKSFLFGITFLFASCFTNTNQCVASVAPTLNNNNKQCIERSISHRPSWEILKGGGNGNEKELLLKWKDMIMYHKCVMSEN